MQQDLSAPLLGTTLAVGADPVFRAAATEAVVKGGSPNSLLERWIRLTLRLHAGKQVVEQAMATGDQEVKTALTLLPGVYWRIATD